MIKNKSGGRYGRKIESCRIYQEGYRQSEKEGYKGIHSIYSGFNEAFKKYFEGENPVEVTNRLSQEGKIVLRPVKGGVMLYLPEDSPGSSSADEAFKKMGL